MVISRVLLNQILWSWTFWKSHKTAYNFLIVISRWFNVYQGQTKQFPRSVQKFQRTSISGDQLSTAITLKPFSLLLWKFDTSKISKLSTTLLLKDSQQTLSYPYNLLNNQNCPNSHYNWIIEELMFHCIMVPIVHMNHTHSRKHDGQAQINYLNTFINLFGH